MRTIIRLLFTTALIVAVNLPLSAQTSDDKWVSLGDYMKDMYQLGGSSALIDYSPKDGNNTIDGLRFITKIAYKKTAKSFLESAKLILRPLGWNGAEPVLDNNNLIVSHSFDITENGVKTKSKNIPENSEGWKVKEFDKPLAIWEVKELFSSEGLNTPIFKNIYVSLDPSLDPTIIAAQKGKEAKAAEEKERAEERAAERAELSTALYISPERSGMKPIRTDNLANGVICEHYNGFRFYKKPNGDFATYPEMPDTRDDKTLNVIKGMDAELFRGYGMKNGAYQLTLPNGAKMVWDGIDSTSIIFNGGDKLVMTAKDFGVNMFYIPFYEFIEPNTYTPYTIGLLHEPDSCIYYSNGKEYSDIIFVKKSGSHLIEYMPGVSQYYSGVGYFSNGNYVRYDIESDGPQPAFFLTDGGYLYHKVPVEKYAAGQAFFTNGDEIKFGDGNNSSELSISITLHDGTKVETFPDVQRYKITYPNGDTYVSATFDPYNYSPDSKNLIPAINSFELAGGKFKPFYKGVLTKANGKEYVYENGKSPQDRAAEEAQANQAYASLCKKYGKVHVDNALRLNYTTGMSLELLKEIGSMPIYDSESSTGTWYKVVTDVSPSFDLTYRWIHVNKSTGKIDFVGSARRN